jgi:hypothetical protein
MSSKLDDKLCKLKISHVQQLPHMLFETCRALPLPIQFVFAIPSLHTSDLAQADAERAPAA